MKKTILLTILSVLTLNVFSQLLPTFNLYVINPDGCQYTLTGSYVAYGNGNETVGSIEFSPAGALDMYIGYLPSADSVHYVICGVTVPPCSGQNCVEGWLYLGPDGNFGSITMMIANTLMDMDGDGYTSNIDCDDTNPWAYPGAFEECNGIDNNCDGMNDIVPSINMYFVPDSLVQEENTIYLINSSINCNSYSWDFGNGDSSQIDFPTSQYDTTGTFQICVMVASQDGCFSDTCFTFTIIDSTTWNPGGMIMLPSWTLNVVQEYSLSVVDELNSNLSVWPNPVNNTLNINNPLSKGIIQIISLDGKIVQSQSFNSRTNQIDVSNIKQGMYILNVSDNKNTIKSHFIKQ